jgi:hypothetical protein
MKNAKGTSIYEALNLINGSFRQILQELERIEHTGGFKGRASIKAVELALKEMRDWTLFEILDVLHQSEEDEWTRFGRARRRHEQADAKRKPRLPQRIQPTDPARKA